MRPDRIRVRAALAFSGECAGANSVQLAAVAGWDAARTGSGQATAQAAFARDAPKPSA